MAGSGYLYVALVRRMGCFELTSSIQDEKDEFAHFVCVDGEILQIEPQGKASCEATNVLDGYRISVYA